MRLGLTSAHSSFDAIRRTHTRRAFSWCDSFARTNVNTIKIWSKLITTEVMCSKSVCIFIPFKCLSFFQLMISPQCNHMNEMREVLNSWAEISVYGYAMDNTVSIVTSVRNEIETPVYDYTCTYRCHRLIILFSFSLCFRFYTMANLLYWTKFFEQILEERKQCHFHLKHILKCV